VALYAIEKALSLGAKVITASDSSGYIHDPDGIDAEKLAYLIDLKEVRRGRIHEYADQFPAATYYDTGSVWSVPTQVALPCATQNELHEADARELVRNGLVAVAEGANMPTTPQAHEVLMANAVLFAPGKAANAGGVAVSGLEQSQNSLRISWSRGEVDAKLQNIMHEIHRKCVQYGDDGSEQVNYSLGANLGGFVKVADAMLAYGAV